MKRLVLFLLSAVILLYLLKENRFLIVRDRYFFEPAYRVSKIIENDTFFSLTERYYVFNYINNKNTFLQTSLQMVCDSLGNVRKISSCYFDFQDVGLYLGKYKENRPLSSAVSKNIFSVTWEIEHPDSISLLYEDKSGIREERHKLECSFSTLDNGSKDGD